MGKIVEESIEKYLHCTEESYKEVEDILNIIIKLITDKNDVDLNEFVE